MSSRRGRFITFEGLDGSGKTTQLHRLAESLKRSGRQVVVTREPGGTAIGEKIRSLLLDSRTQGLAARAEMTLMFASRAQHIHELIKPALREGKVVLCDRFTDSSEAYQGFGRQLGGSTVLDMHAIVCQDLQPDLTILLSGDPQAHLDRARLRNRKGSDKEGRFESEEADFFRRVLRGYRQISRREPKRVIIVDASRAIEEVHANILGIIKERLPGVL